MELQYELVVNKLAEQPWRLQLVSKKEGRSE
jgi:hypothetical protein